MVEKILNNTTPYGQIRASHEGSLHSSTLNACIVTWINRKTVLPKPLKKNRKTIEFSSIATGNLRKNVLGFRSGDKILQSSNVFDFFSYFPCIFGYFSKAITTCWGCGEGQIFALIILKLKNANAILNPSVLHCRTIQFCVLV